MSASIYIAAPLSLYAVANDWQRKLVSDGHEVVSHWHEIVRDQTTQVDPTDSMTRAQILEENLRDLHNARVVLAIMTGGIPRATYGEIGYALATGRRVVWLKGQNTCIFDAHPLSHVLDDERDVRQWLAGFGYASRLTMTAPGVHPW